MMDDGRKDIDEDYNKPLIGPSWRIWRHKRYVIAILGFLGLVNQYALRVNLNIAIVDMTEMKNIVLENGTIITKQDFEWDSVIQGYILSAFFYGYILTQILGGYLATKCGGAKMFGFGIGLTSFFTLMSPWIVNINVYFFIVIRALVGFCEGVTLPSLQEVWSHWAPPAEKGRLVSIAISGIYFGAVVALPVCSLLATAFGWELIFYGFGGIGLVWSIFWFIIVKDTPTQDKKMSAEERQYIIDAVSTIKSDENITVPWLKIITSPAVLGYTLCVTCETWGWFTLLTYIPQMMTSLLGFSLNQSGFISALPYLVMVVVVQIGGFISDFIITRKWLTLTHTRRLFIATGMSSQAVFLIIAGYWVSTVGTPLCIVLAVGLAGLTTCGQTVLPLDIAPKFAGMIFGLANTVASIPGIISPILTGYILTDQTDVTQWRTIFFISAGVYMLGVLCCLFLVTGERQSWADKSKLVTEVEQKDDKSNSNGLQMEA